MPHMKHKTAHKQDLRSTSDNCALCASMWLTLAVACSSLCDRPNMLWFFSFEWLDGKHAELSKIH